ncbi:hypothetical protein WwAna1313, partial [Wolbachia endosymbiont of Drosophila ananassae]
VGFSASGYYKWTTRKISSRESANKELLADIQKIYKLLNVDMELLKFMLN